MRGGRAPVHRVEGASRARSKCRPENGRTPEFQHSKRPRETGPPRPSKKPARASIAPGGMYAGSGIAPPVRILGGAIHTFGQCAARCPVPPGNSSEFQAHAGLFFRIEKIAEFFDALEAALARWNGAAICRSPPRLSSSRSRSRSRNRSDLPKPCTRSRSTTLPE